MDPYNDPNRQQSYPGQQQPQAYYPPIQGGPYPQQSNPYPQQVNPAYNPNAIQYIPYAQQPGGPVYVNQTSNLAELDQGCFQCYKVLLYIFLIFGVLGIGSLISQMTQYSELVGYLIGLIILEILRLTLIVIQIQAIQQRDFKKAKMALSGFVCYMFASPIYQFGFSFIFVGYLDETMVSYAIGSIVGFVIFVLIGSIQVYQLLKRNQPQSDSYQNINNTTGNNNVTA